MAETTSTEAEATPEHDREVLNREVINYAKRNCIHCAGVGVLTRRVSHHGGGPVVRGQYGLAESVCQCAAKRFVRVNEVNLIADPSGKLFWKKGRAP